MKYMGSKKRHAKELLPIILKDRLEGQYYVEPFAGGMNMIDKVDGCRIANDINKYVIDFFIHLQKGWTPPEHITISQYNFYKNNKDFDLKMTAWAGICCSYGGKWFGGYINDYKENRRLKNGRLPNHQTESRNSVIKQIKSMEKVSLSSIDYLSMEIPQNSLIYCDPPYENTTSYKDKFDHFIFWEWCRKKTIEGHMVFISEYSAPNDFICVKEILTNTQLGNGCNTGSQLKTEKLFIHKSQL